MLAATLLLTLVAGSIAWPAAASGPLCTLSCCTGRAPHAAGSRMHSSCAAGISIGSPIKNTQHAHHHEQQPVQESNRSSAFAGVTASVGGSEMDAVPTIEATSEDSSTNNAQSYTAEPASNRSAATGMSATVLSKPCQYDCGACAPGFAGSKRSRNAGALAQAHHAQPPPSVKLVDIRDQLMLKRSAQGRQSVPRGPPPMFL